MDDVSAFAATFRRFMEVMNETAHDGPTELGRRIEEHLGVDPSTLAVTAVDLPQTSRPNLQLALDAVLPDAELLGYRLRYAGRVGVGIADIVEGQGMTGPIKLGPPAFTDVEVGDGRVIRCVTAGVWLARVDDAPVVLALGNREGNGMGPGDIVVEALSPADGAPSRLVEALRVAMRRLNVYRGKVISLHGHPHGGSASVQFHTLAQVSRESVILPAGTLERLEKHAIGMIAGADALRAAGRHLKRGILMHGPPGTGKTLTIGYLLASMPGRTTVLLTGRGLGFIEQAIAIGRELAPATVVFEDVDLVAAERTMMYGDNGGLFELLNQMEGLADDEDLLFLLTSNRPDLLEPALAARPGRVDLALEIPLPDADGRRRLVELYLPGIDGLATVVERTEGLTGAFIRELARQAALTAALERRDAPDAGDVLKALDELLADRSALTRRLLGEGGGENPPPPGPAVW